MLLQRTEVKEGEIATFRLVSGEEIVGKFLNLNQDGDVKINKPVILGVQMVGPQQASLGFMPFLAAAPDDFTIVFPKHSLVTSLLLARKDVANSYISATSGIAIPTKTQQGIILGS